MRVDVFGQQYAVGLNFLVFFLYSYIVINLQEVSVLLSWAFPGRAVGGACVLSHKDGSGGEKCFLDTEPTNSVFSKLVFQLKGLLVSLREILGPL